MSEPIYKTSERMDMALSATYGYFIAGSRSKPDRRDMLARKYARTGLTPEQRARASTLIEKDRSARNYYDNRLDLGLC